MSYMAGTSCIIAEAGGVNFFLQQLDADNDFLPSPLGYVGQEFYNFTQNHPDPGVPYTLFGVLLDYYHGTHPGFGPQEAFEYFPYDFGDKMSGILKICFSRIVGHWAAKRMLVNSPYGDTCDFLQQDANQSVLDAYPVIIPSGDIQFLPSQIQNLINYTKNGGILVLNQMYLNQFPAGFMQNAQYLSTFNPVLIQNYGHGKIIFYGPDFDTTQLGPIIKQLESQLLPFQVNGNVAYQINRRASSWVITLMNNKGVTKNPFDASVVDESQAQNVQIAYRGSVK